MLGGKKMIRVISHGRARILETVCNDCGCRFEYTESDGELDRDNGKQYIVCPDCGRRFRMPEPWQLRDREA